VDIFFVKIYLTDENLANILKSLGGDIHFNQLSGSYTFHYEIEQFNDAVSFVLNLKSFLEDLKRS